MDTQLKRFETVRGCSAPLTDLELMVYRESRAFGFSRNHFKTFQIDRILPQPQAVEFGDDATDPFDVRDAGLGAHA